MLSFLKSVLLAMPLICLSVFSYGNEIDQLKTKEDVNRFLTEKVNPKWKNRDFLTKGKLPIGFNPIQFNPSIPSEDVFFKIDLNRNGTTDLIVCYSDDLMVIMDEGTGKYGIHYITQGFDGRKKLMNIIYVDQYPLLVTQKFEEYTEKKAPVGGPDTILYKFGDFIEFNKMPDSYQLDYISFSASACFGTCPVFELKIDGERNIAYDGNGYDKRGHHNAILDTSMFNILVNRLNYINVGGLKSNYTYAVTDMPTYRFEIKFKGGAVKKVSDYANMAPLGLENLSTLIFAIATKNGWLTDED